MEALIKGEVKGALMWLETVVPRRLKSLLRCSCAIGKALASILLVAILFGWAQAAPSVPQQGITEGWITHANADRVNVLRAQGDTLWAGSRAGGLVGWDVTTGTFVHLLYPQGRLAGNAVTAITIAPDGTLWAATTAGVSRYPPDAPGENLTLKNTGRRLDQRATVQERAITGEDRIRLDLSSESAVLSAFSPGYLMFGTDPTIYFYRDWDEANQAVVISPALLRSVDPGTPVYAVDIGLAADDVRDVVVDHSGRVWISTVNGVSIYEAGEWTVYTAFNSPLIANATGPMAVDGAGRVWISHPERGQFTMFDGEWHAYQIAGAIQSLVVRPEDGQVWAATTPLCDATGVCSGGGVWAFDGDRWQQRYQIGDGIADDKVDSIAFGTDGRLWLGHESATGVAVSRWTGSGWHIYQTIQAAIEADFNGILTTQTPTDLWAVAGGWVWTRHLGAVRGYAPGQGWKVLYTGETVLNSNHTRAIATDEAGRVWVGTERMFDGQTQTGGGVNMWDGTRWTHYLAENSNLPDDLVSKITVGRNRVWVETLTGYGRFMDGAWTAYPDITRMVEAEYWAIIDARDMPGLNDNRLWTVDDADRVWVWEGNGVRDGVQYYRPDTGWVGFTFQNTLRKKEPAVTYLQQRAPARETRIVVSAVDIPDSATAQSRFASGYLMIGDDPTVYRYESFQAHPREDVNVLQVSPPLQTTLDANAPVYAVEPGLLSNVVRDATMGPDGRLWFATRPGRLGATDVYGGVSVFDVETDTWTNYTVANTSRRGPVVGSVTEEVLARNTRVPASFADVSAADQALSSGFVMFEHDPTLYRYLGFDDGALIVKPIFSSAKYEVGVQQTLPAGTQIYAVELGLLGTPKGDSSADRLAVDHAGRMWIAVQDVGISVLDDLGGWTNYRRADDGLADARVAGMFARGEEMWVWTDGGGVSIFRAGSWQTYNVFNSGLVDNEVEALAITVNGEAWMATHDSGISVLTLPGFRLDLGLRAVLLTPGGTAAVRFDVVPVGGFSGQMSFTIEGVPPDVSASFTPDTLSGYGTVTLTLTASELAAHGRYPLTIIGRSADGLTATRRLTLHLVPSIFRAYLPVVTR